MRADTTRTLLLLCLHVSPNADIRRGACICGAMQEEKIEQLLAFGFDSAAARAALEACGWDVEAAANRLLS